MSILFLSLIVGERGRKQLTNPYIELYPSLHSYEKFPYPCLNFTDLSPYSINRTDELEGDKMYF